MLDRLVDLFIQFIGLFKCWVVMFPYEAGVQIRLGKFVKILEPGFHWILPLGIDKYEHEHTVPRTHTLEQQSVTLADGKQVGFQSVITYKVRDIKMALLEIEDSEHAIRDACAGTIAHTVSRCTWHELVETDDWVDKVTKACRQRGFKFGLEITSVQFATLSIVKTIRLLNR
jgi:regulator of protease activity HflC (stomatin/prohibitin superfamily)